MYSTFFWIIVFLRLCLIWWNLTSQNMWAENWYLLDYCLHAHASQSYWCLHSSPLGSVLGGQMGYCEKVVDVYHQTPTFWNCIWLNEFCLLYSQIESVDINYSVSYYIAPASACYCCEQYSSLITLPGVSVFSVSYFCAVLKGSNAECETKFAVSDVFETHTTRLPWMNAYVIEMVWLDA